MATVLVVDDEIGVADLLESVLGDEGHRVLSAINGKQGLEILGEERTDLVITDFMMPGMDGAALLRAMAADAALRAIPVIVMSGMPEANVAARCAGYAGFVRKPFDINEMIEMATRLLRLGPAG